MEGRPYPFRVDKLIREHSQDSVIVRNFSQLGKSERQLDWLRQQLIDPNLFYPDEELAREKAEAYRQRFVGHFDQASIDRAVNWMYYEFKAPRPINLNVHPLAVAIASIIFNMYSR